MANVITSVTYTADGSTSIYAVPFDYLSKTHVHIYINDVETTAYTYLTNYSVKFTTVPTAGTVVKVQRITPYETQYVTWSDGSVLVSDDLNAQNLQALYVLQETSQNLEELDASVVSTLNYITLNGGLLYTGQYAVDATVLNQADVTIKNSLAWWINQIGNISCTIHVPCGTYSIADDITIPSNICLDFDKGGILSVASGKTLTINGPIDAGLWQIFSGAGTVAGSYTYINTNVAQTIADLRLNKGTVGMAVKTLGYYSVDDGGGADYIIISGDYTDDGGSYIALANGLFAKLTPRNNVYNIKQFGAFDSEATTIGTIAAGSTSLTVTDMADFKTGMGVCLLGAGASGANLITKIASISGMVITLTDAADTAVTSATLYHDAAANITATCYAARFGNVYIPTGTYYSTSFAASFYYQANTVYRAPRIIEGEGNFSAIRAIPGTTTLMSFVNTTGRQLRNFMLYGNSEAGNILLNTDWLLNDAPSVQNKYYNVRVAYGGTLFWQANHNNDCEFKRCNSSGVTQADTVILRCLGNGGMVTFDECYFIQARVQVTGQLVTFNDGCMGGVEIIPGDLPIVCINGGYWYSYGKADTIVYLSAPVATLEFNNTYTIFKQADANIVNGSSISNSGIKMDGCFLINESGANVETIGSIYQAVAKISRLLLDHCAYKSTINVDYNGTYLSSHKIDCVMDGSLQPSTLRASGNYGRKSDLTPWKLEIASNKTENCGTMLFTKRVTLSSTAVNITFPDGGPIHFGNGILMIAAADGANGSTAPSAIYAISKSNSGAALIQTIVGNTGVFTLSWPAADDLTLAATNTRIYLVTLLWNGTIPASEL